MGTWTAELIDGGLLLLISCGWFCVCAGSLELHQAPSVPREHSVFTAAGVSAGDRI